MASYNHSNKRLFPEDYQLAATSSLVLLTLPSSVGTYKVTIGPIVTSGAEATNSTGAVTWGDATLTGVETFESASSVKRRRLDAGSTYQYTMASETDWRPVKVAIATANADDIVHITYDGEVG